MCSVCINNFQGFFCRPWHDDINDIVDDKYEIILGFNEPNHSDQSDIPPEGGTIVLLEC